MSFLNKNAAKCDEFINPVDKQIAEIFMINAGLNELSNGSNKSSGGGLHRSGSDRKHTWLQDLNEDDGGQYFDDLAESGDEKSINRDSIGGDWSTLTACQLAQFQLAQLMSLSDDFNAENANPGGNSGAEFAQVTLPKSSKSAKSKKYST